MVHKRDFLKGMAAAVAAMAGMPGASLAQKERFSMDDVHLQILRYINTLKNKPSSLRILAPDGCQPNLMPIIDMFRQETKIDAQLNITPVDDINTKLMLSVSAGEAEYDIALPATFGIPDLAAMGAIQSLDDLVQECEPKGFQKDVLYTSGDDYSGKFYGYQTDGDAYLMFYHKGWLEDESFRKRYADQYAKPLAVPETLEELDQQIRFFHEPKAGRYGGSLFRSPGYLVWEWWIRFHAKGFYPLADNLMPQIDNDAGVQALEELIAISAYLSPGAKENGLFDNWREFSQGNSYCNIGWGGTQKYLNSPKSAMKNNLAFSATPGGYVKDTLISTPYFNWGWNYTIPRYAKNKEIAYLFTLFATSPHVSTVSVRQNGYFDPYRQSHYLDEQIQDMYSKEFLQAHAFSMLNSIPDF